jgi:hypothetical protein
MDEPIIHDEATHCVILEACGPPNILGAPIEAKQEPQLLFLGLPGPENSPNVLRNGPASLLAAKSSERLI